MIPASAIILAQEWATHTSPPLVATAAIGAATVATGLAAGVFYTFQVSIINALKEVNDDAYVATFQAINRRIQNPGFAVTFVGAPVLTVTALATWWGEDGPTVATIATGLTLQIASLAITVVGNVPLNQELNRAGPVSGVQATSVRQQFERQWNRLHAIRTFASIGSFVALAGAAVLSAR